MLITLLLATSTAIPPWLAYTGLFSLIVSILSVGFTIWFAFRKETKEDTKEEAKEWKDLVEKVKHQETKLESHEGRFTAGQNQLEQLANTFENRFKGLEGKVEVVHDLSQKVSRVEAALDNTKESVDKLERRMDTRLERMEDKLDNLLSAINNLPTTGQRRAGKYPNT